MEEFKVSWSLVHEKGQNGVGDQQVDMCSICCDTDFVSVCRGEERAEPKGEALYYSVNVGMLEVGVQGVLLKQSRYEISD